MCTTQPRRTKTSNTEQLHETMKRDSEKKEHTAVLDNDKTQSRV
jgi:hypothetical protein